MKKILHLALVGLLGISCIGGGSKAAKMSIKTPNTPGEPIQLTAKIVNTYPHNTSSYTQGLFIHNGIMYESTGGYGESKLMQVSLETGLPLKTVKLTKEYFGEGTTILNDKIYQLTWESNKGFIYDTTDMKKIGEFHYVGEGWGLTTDGEKLYMSDGTSMIQIIDPKTMRPSGSIEVRNMYGRVEMLNELEWVGTEIWANIYGENTIVAIDPTTGFVTKSINCDNLVGQIKVTPDTDVFNGIAVNKANGKIFVTGKNWDKLFEITIDEKN